MDAKDIEQYSYCYPHYHLKECEYRFVYALPIIYSLVIIPFSIYLVHISKEYLQNNSVAIRESVQLILAMMFVYVSDIVIVSLPAYISEFPMVNNNLLMLQQCIGFIPYCIIGTQISRVLLVMNAKYANLLKFWYKFLEYLNMLLIAINGFFLFYRDSQDSIYSVFDIMNEIIFYLSIIFKCSFLVVGAYAFIFIDEKKCPFSYKYIVWMRCLLFITVFMTVLYLITYVITYSYAPDMYLFMNFKERFTGFLVLLFLNDFIFTFMAYVVFNVAVALIAVMENEDETTEENVNVIAQDLIGTSFVSGAV